MYKKDSKYINKTSYKITEHHTDQTDMDATRIKCTAQGQKGQTNDTYKDKQKMH